MNNILNQIEQKERFQQILLHPTVVAVSKEKAKLVPNCIGTPGSPNPQSSCNQASSIFTYTRANNTMMTVHTTKRAVTEIQTGIRSRT